LTVPGEQGLGRNDCGDVRQEFPPKTFRFRRQSPALIVVEPNASPSELLAKNAVFLTKVFDYQQLTLVHPAGDSNHDESEWIQDSRHLVTSLSRPSTRLNQRL